MKKYLLLYVILCFLLALNLTLYVLYGISIRGYWSDRILFWIWLLNTLFLIYRFWHRKGIKIYAISLVGLIILSMVPFMIPFTAIMFADFGLDRSFSKALDENMIVQVSTKSFLGGSTPEIIEQKGIYEKLVGTTNGWHMSNDDVYLEDAHDLKIVYDKGKAMFLQVHIKQDTFRYEINKFGLVR